MLLIRNIEIIICVGETRTEYIQDPALLAQLERFRQDNKRLADQFAELNKRIEEINSFEDLEIIVVKMLQQQMLGEQQENIQHIKAMAMFYMIFLVEMMMFHILVWNILAFGKD